MNQRATIRFQYSRDKRACIGQRSASSFPARRSGIEIGGGVRTQRLDSLLPQPRQSRKQMKRFANKPSIWLRCVFESVVRQ
jgi:hypothetical protein